MGQQSHITPEKVRAASLCVFCGEIELEIEIKIEIEIKMIEIERDRERVGR